MQNNFKKKYSFEKRLEESREIIEKYTGRVPIIVEKHHDCTLPTVDKCKYLVPKDMTIMEFVYVVRKRIELKPSQSLFITINSRSFVSKGEGNSKLSGVFFTPTLYVSICLTPEQPTSNNIINVLISSLI